MHRVSRTTSKLWLIVGVVIALPIILFTFYAFLALSGLIWFLPYVLWHSGYILGGLLIVSGLVLGFLHWQNIRSRLAGILVLLATSIFLILGNLYVHKVNSFEYRQLQRRQASIKEEKTEASTIKFPAYKLSKLPAGFVRETASVVASSHSPSHIIYELSRESDGNAYLANVTMLQYATGTKPYTLTALDEAGCSNNTRCTKIGDSNFATVYKVSQPSTYEISYFSSNNRTSIYLEIVDELNADQLAMQTFNSLDEVQPQDLPY